MSKKLVKNLVCDNCTAYNSQGGHPFATGVCKLKGMFVHAHTPFCHHFNPNWVLTVVTTPEYASQYSDRLSADCII